MHDMARMNTTAEERHTMRHAMRHAMPHTMRHAILTLTGVAMLWFAPVRISGQTQATQVAQAKQATQAKSASELPPAHFDEPYRPQYHFTPAINWTNDPNGAVYYQGEYHLFYQFNPFGDQWGHMTWGHAVSPDLVHWQQLPPAIPEEDGVMIFSGSVVVDWKNSSGFCTSQAEGHDKAGNFASWTVPCLVAIYAGHTEHDAKRDGKPLQTQNLAFSNDRGRSWTKFSGNPVIDLHLSDFRDPKVFWHQGTQRWVMVVSLPAEHKVRFFSSKNLREWEPLSDFGPAGATDGFWECPDLFELPVINATGASAKTRWVLSVNINPGAPAGGSGNQYFVGTFDGKTFTSDNPAETKLWADYGKDFYASTSFSDAPNGRRIWIAWMSNWDYARDVPTSPWRGGMTIPRELKLGQTSDGLRLVQAPVAELATLRAAAFTMQAATAEQVNSAIRNQSFGESFEVEMDVELGKSKSAGLKVRVGKGEATVVGINGDPYQLVVNRSFSSAIGFNQKFAGLQGAPLIRQPGALHLRVFVDRASVEVFNEETAITDLIFPSAGSLGIEFFSDGRQATFRSVKIWKLKSAVRY